MNYFETIELMALLDGVIKVLSCNYNLSCFYCVSEKHVSGCIANMTGDV